MKDTIVIHHSNTPNGVTQARFEGKLYTYDVVEIDDWHRQRKGITMREDLNERPHLKWFGYHVLGNINGTMAKGRSESEKAWAAGGYNTRGLHYCMVGRDKFSGAQWTTLKAQVLDWMDRFDIEKTVGHRDVGGDKGCPGFNVQQWLDGGMLPLAAHTHT